MRAGLVSILAVILLPLFGGVGCNEDSGEAKGTVILSGPLAVILPPGHPGSVSGSTLVIPVPPTPPSVRQADCFAGVPDPGDIGIGSAAGYTKDYIGSVILPVNLNLGDTVLGGYTIRIEVAHPSLEIDPAAVAGSYPWLATDNCLDRDCPLVCSDQPESYPRQFNPAPGFEPTPIVSGDASGITVEAGDAKPGTPTTGVVNLCHLRINILGDLPPAGATVFFSVKDLKHPSGAAIKFFPVPDGIIIENFKYQ